MKSLLCVVAAAIALAAQAVAALADGPPKFADYPVKVYFGKPAKPRLVTQDLRDRRELFLDAASEGKINAAGRYFVIKMPCGSACAAPYLLDARSGRIIELFTVSGWHEISRRFRSRREPRRQPVDRIPRRAQRGRHRRQPFTWWRTATS